MLEGNKLNRFKATQVILPDKLRGDLELWHQGAPKFRGDLWTLMMPCSWVYLLEIKFFGMHWSKFLNFGICLSFLFFIMIYMKIHRTQYYPHLSIILFSFWKTCAKTIGNFRYLSKSRPRLKGTDFCSKPLQNNKPLGRNYSPSEGPEILCTQTGVSACPRSDLTH